MSDIGLQQVHFSEPRADGPLPHTVTLERNQLCNALRTFFNVRATDPNVEQQREHKLKYSLETGALTTSSAAVSYQRSNQYTLSSLRVFSKRLLYTINLCFSFKFFSGASNFVS